jgi:hypothetical protein
VRPCWPARMALATPVALPPSAPCAIWLPCRPAIADALSWLICAAVASITCWVYGFWYCAIVDALIGAVEAPARPAACEM